MDTEGKKAGGFTGIFVVMLISLIIASLWNKVELIRKGADFILDPTAGALLNWNITYGMLIIVFIISLIMTIVQKYATDQKAIREMKNEQKRLSEEMKKVKDNPDKFMELQKESMKIAIPLMRLGMRPVMFTAVPLILFFRWFIDYFNAVGEFKFFGFLSWFWFYLIGTIIFSSILRKIMNIV